MLNEKLIGSYISSLRKEKDLTQVELAEQVSVSHQAVSKWERGDSLPDIGTLLTLATLFGTTVDSILSGGRTNQGFRNVGSLVQELSDNRPDKAAAYINEGEADVSGFVSIAPFLKAGTVEQVTEGIDDQTLTTEYLVQLAPFLDSGTLSGYIAKKGHVETDQLIAIAPFIDSKTLKQLINTDDHDLNIEDVICIAPFLEDDLDQLVLETSITNPNMEYVHALAPFIKTDTLLYL
ncbi:helix-turn-helix domain-containing protein, partial [Virgibacillus sp. DJP39]|uniref:helix-turn-helix domain-containing protein n=1 Tax=Virgibacillus sp. DJP39 TaxID=3409790 RepID=UPI003BB5E5C3